MHPVLKRFPVTKSSLFYYFINQSAVERGNEMENEGLGKMQIRDTWPSSKYYSEGNISVIRNYGVLYLCTLLDTHSLQPRLISTIDNETNKVLMLRDQQLLSNRRSRAAMGNCFTVRI